MGRVTPIHKSGNISDQNNFSLLVFFVPSAKFLKDTYTMYNFFLKNNLLYLAQAGFCTLHCYETAHTRIADMWTANIKKVYLMGYCFIGLEKGIQSS